MFTPPFGLLTQCQIDPVNTAHPDPPWQHANPLRYDREGLPEKIRPWLQITFFDSQESPCYAKPMRTYKSTNCRHRSKCCANATFTGGRTHQEHGHRHMHVPGRYDDPFGIKSATVCRLGAARGAARGCLMRCRTLTVLAARGSAKRLHSPVKSFSNLFGPHPFVFLCCQRAFWCVVRYPDTPVGRKGRYSLHGYPGKGMW
jgi:hypothetical protein